LFAELRKKLTASQPDGMIFSFTHLLSFNQIDLLVQAMGRNLVCMDSGPKKQKLFVRRFVSTA